MRLPFALLSQSILNLSPAQNTAAATEGHVFPSSETAATPAPFKQAPFSCDVSTVPVNDNASVTLDGSGEAHDSHSISTHAPIQLTNGELPTSPSEAETAKDTPLESAPQPDYSVQDAQDTSAVTDRVDVPPTPAPAAASEPTATQPKMNFVENAAQSHRRQATLPASISQVSTPSTPSSSTLTHKKRRSLFARIKHIFDKKHDKQGEKEKNKG
ncbi:hypothetical protein OG21DRAFT_863490 [Imleria badia]|nr:hypothetical protein OG21DRAFT_863490 [Imleria badia]